MLFSEFFSVGKDQDDDWFDPILHQDTKLFIDPFLIFKNEYGFFQGVHSNIMRFFNIVFELIAKAGNDKNSINYKKALHLLRFHEVNEICLGYSNSRDGAGPGDGWSDIIASNIMKCINRGVVELRHFEEISLFSVGIGPDSISDITANLIKECLVLYTQDICTKKGIPMEPVKLYNGKLDRQFLRWEHPNTILPINAFKGSGILLVPKNYLNILPEINSYDFWNTVADNDVLRNDLNFEIDRNLRKEDIARIALENYSLVNCYIDLVENRDVYPYDLEEDKLLKYQWYNLAKKISSEFPLKLNGPSSKSDFIELVMNIAMNFKHFVEYNSGYKLLWDDKYRKSKSEESAQLLFHGIVSEHCKANNIDLSREVNQGRGPVDFKFSNGYIDKILLEIKLANNTKFWHGIEEQLPLYLKCDSCSDGIFMIIAYRKEDFERINEIFKVIQEVNKKENISINPIIIDATPYKPSASKI